MNVSAFIDHHFRHYNAATLKEAAQGWRALLDNGGKMFVTMAGAMSTAELGVSLAEMIRQGKVHAITCTGANLEEDLFNLVAHDAYERIPNWRELSAEDEKALLERGLNRVTDTCIPEHEAMRKVERVIMDYWRSTHEAGERGLPHQFLYRIIRDEVLADSYQIDPKDSWLVEAAKRDLPLFVPGWEDSTLGNMFVAMVLRGELPDTTVMRPGVDYMVELASWYRKTTAEGPLGFFQIGGGIAGDFPICVVPMLHQDMSLTEVPLWAYFCQISEATTSYGGYSGAVPNEKITWGKLDADTPRFMIESDATICAPLIFAYVLGL